MSNGTGDINALWERFVDVTLALHTHEMDAVQVAEQFQKLIDEVEGMLAEGGRSQLDIENLGTRWLPSFYVGLGQALNIAGRSDEALSAFEKGCRLNMSKMHNIESFVCFLLGRGDYRRCSEILNALRPEDIAAEEESTAKFILECSEEHDSLRSLLSTDLIAACRRIAG